MLEGTCVVSVHRAVLTLLLSRDFDVKTDDVHIVVRIVHLILIREWTSYMYILALAKHDNT